jgi:RimJ/RimL family protein N-acetyltransferase
MAEQDTAGIDLAIGDVASTGIGLGPIAIRDFIARVVSGDPGISAVVADPEERNRRSCRAFEKAGFIATATVELEGESVRRRVMRLALSTRPSNL